MCIWNIKKSNAARLQGCTKGGLVYAMAVEKYGINAAEVQKIFNANIEFYYNPENGKIYSCGKDTPRRIKNKSEKGQLEVEIDAYMTWKPTITKMTLSEKTGTAQKNLEESIKLYNERWPEN